jgi:hypothetical protein
VKDGRTAIAKEALDLVQVAGLHRRCDAEPEGLRDG